MVQGVGKTGMSEVQMKQVSGPATSNGTGGEGGYLSHQVDAKESARDPQFGEVYKNIQAKYGEKPQKPREIKKTLEKTTFLRS